MPTKAYYEKNKDKIKQQVRQYYQNNRETVLEKARKGAAQYYYDHKEEVLTKRKKTVDKSALALKERDRHLRRRYGVDLQWYESTLKAQGGGCAICGKGAGKKSLHVDHCHKTKRVRGILCATCNGVLGRFSENIARFERVIEYLKQS